MYKDMTDYDLAMALDDWMTAASLRWSDFSESEKSFFRQLESEACKRFINEHIEEEAADDKSDSSI